MFDISDSPAAERAVAPVNRDESLNPGTRPVTIA